MSVDFKPGDTVMLKSGGPTMTYERTAQEGEGVCVWFEGTAKKQSTFMHATLEKIDNDPKWQTGGAFVV